MQPLISGDALANDIQMHYYRTPQTPRRSSPVLVMLHGITDSGLCWPRVVAALADDYAMILPDARGHGLSDKPAQGYAPTDHAADVAGLIEALGLERPVLAGHSMGGAVAALTAALYPELVSGVILEDPAWPPQAPEVTTEERAESAAKRRKEILDRQAMTPEQVIARRKAEQPTWDDAEFPDWAVAKMQVSPEVTKFIMGLTTPWQDTARALRCPTLLITADVEQGAIISRQQAAEAQRVNPRINVAYVPGVGHNIRREDFEAYLAAVRQFLETLN